MVHFLLAQQAGSRVGMFANFLPILLIIGIFYLLIYRPMRRRQKALETMISGLKNGDKVITSGGVYGTVVRVLDHSVLLKVADQVKIEVAKASISSLQSTPKDPAT